MFILETDYLHTLFLVPLSLPMQLLLKDGLKIQYYIFEKLYPNILHSGKAEIYFQQQQLNVLSKHLLHVTFQVKYIL